MNKMFNWLKREEDIYIDVCKLKEELEQKELIKWQDKTRRESIRNITKEERFFQ